MKQSTTFAQVANNLLTVLQGYSKTIRLLLVMFLTLTITTNAWGATITINGNASGITTTDGNQTITVDGITFKGKFKQYSTTALWFTSGTGYIYNTTSLGTINSITINYKSGGSASSKQYFTSGNSAITSYQSGTPQITTSTGGASGTHSSFSGGFFNISISNKNLQATSIVIDYTPTGGGGSTPTQLAAPTGLTESNITSSGATLSWNAVANASSYIVTIVDGGSLKQDYPATGTTKTVNDLTPSTDYLWTVTAVGDGINYTNSEESSEIGEFTTSAAGGGGGDEECTWELVTDASTLKADDEVIITASGENNYALSTNQKSSNRGATAITKNGNTLTSPSADVQILALKAGSTSGTWAFYTGTSGYLYAASSSGNQLKTKTTLDEHGSWTISITDGVASIAAEGSSNRNVMQYNYNNGSPLFACYSSASQTSLEIYKKVCTGGATEPSPSLNADPTSLAFGNVATDSNKEMTFTLTGSNLTANASLQLSGINPGMFSLSSNSVTQSAGSINQIITVTYTPTAAGEHTATLTISSTGAESKTVTLSGTGVAPATTYTVTFNAGSGTCDEESLTETSGGAGVTLPTANPPAACATDGWEFAGWWTEEVGATTTSPGELLTAGSNYKPTTNCTLYAVYSHTEAGGGGSGFYLSVTQNATTYYIGEKGSGSFLSAVTDVNSAATFNIENNQYLYYGNKTYVSSTSDNTSLTIATTTPTATWAITEEGETITFKSNGTGGRYLAFNYNNGSPRFSSYVSTYTYELTKHTTSTTTYNSNPSCEVCENILTINKGAETNENTFTLSQSGNVETCDGDVEVVVTPTPAEHYSVSAVTATAPTSGGAPTVTNKGDGTWTVTYAQYSQGESTINVTFVEDAKATITLSELGEPTTDNTTYYVGETYTLPSTSSQSCDGKELVGWSTVEVAETDTKPTENYYELGAEVTLAATQTFYAVFATAEETTGGTVEATLSFANTDQQTSWSTSQQVWEQNGVTFTHDKANGDDIVNNYAPIRCYKNSKITITHTSDEITEIVFDCNTDAYATALENSIGTIDGVAVSKSSDKVTVSFTNAVTSFAVTLSSGQVRLDGITVTAGGGTITTYSDYSTTCVKLPDPVISFVTTPADPIVFDPVNCGSTTSKAQAKTVQVSGENLRDVVEVSVTGPYKIARTASTALKDFTTSLTLDKTAEGAIHSNYQTVYIISTPPAQSTEATTGTLTFTTTKGNTLTVNLSTPTVTCTQYTLTLVDRGVSTEQPTKYYAGATIDEAPADPEGVCTDPIHYVFDGWAEAEVAKGSTTYTKVTFPYTVEGNTTFYAVYRYLDDGGEPSNDFIKVTKEKDDWTGDYVIVDEDAEKAIGNAYQNTNTLTAVDVTIQDNKVVSPSEAVIWQIRKHGENYTMYNVSANKYAYIAKADAKGAGLSATTTNTTQDIQIIFNNGTAKVSGVDIYRCFYYYGTNTEWRTYATGNYNTGALYCRSLESYLYTTSPICGPHLAITEGKDIYVTGGNAGGTRDLVIAQQKVSYKATRLQTSNGLDDGTAPDVKVATNGITVGGVVTSDVKVTIDQTKEQQTDGTYTITGTITVQYQPSANNKQEDIQVQLAVDYNAEARDNFTVHARSLPAEFVIVAKSGDKWYALNGDMNTNAANPANGQVTLDNAANPTQATYAPCNTIYTFDGVPNTGDRTYVRFQGTDGAWLWAASGTNVGIQNNVLKTTPEGNNKAYNWKLETEDNITYKFHNDNSSRLLGLSGEKFGMYASAVQELRILPYVEKCLYNYAPSNLKVSVLKGTYVTLTWDAVAGATKYQYSTNGTTWTDAGTEPTVTINGLDGNTEYTYYIRAYHEDAGVSQECIDYAEITFTTADCDDVPTNITYTADLNSITVSWTAAAPTATIKYNTKEDGTGEGGTINNATSPYEISGGLDKNTTYYIQILADGTCASPIIPVKTEDVEVDIVEWQPQGIIVDINTDETVGVTLENEVSYGSGIGTEATELFFSKYYEASFNVKLVAIYNGTKNIIDLTDYTIQYGKTKWEDSYITLKDFGATKGQIQPGEEIILYSYTENNADDKNILDCVHDAFPDGNWVRVTSTNNDGNGTLSFGGDKTIILCKTEYDDEADEYYDNIIDVIGALKNDPNEGILPTNENTEKPSWGDKEGWVCEKGLSIADDSQIGISTNRCLLIRNNTVTSGDNAVASNMNDFVTLCTEWKGAHVPDNDIDNGVQASCDNFAYVGTFDYSDYYTKYETMGDERVFDEQARNADGTVTIPITELYKHACSNIRVKLTNSNGDLLTDREYKVPIMITSNQGTNGQAFLALQENLATVEVDGNGNPTGNKTNLTLEQVREICKTCDVVVRDNAILTKADDNAADDHPEVRDVYVYQNSSLIVPAGTNYTINNLSLRRKQDTVASVSAYPEALKLPESAAAPISLDFRLSAESWHWFTLPYDCNISEVTWVDGSPAQYNVDWFLMTYDGEKRAATQAGGCWKAYTGTTIKAGEGFILAINGNINNPAHTYELRFPMSKEVLAAEGTDKTVAVRAWGVENNIRPNHKGWNLVGNPYLAYYQRNNITNFEGLRLGQLTGPDPQTGYWEQTGDVPYVVVPVGAGWEAYEQLLASETDLLPFTAYFVQVGKDGTHTSDQDLKVSFDHTKLQLSATPMPASIIQRSATEASEPVIVGVSLTNAKGESDKTSLIIDNQYTDEYEMNADFFKWFGDYYKYYTKPVLYTVGADQGKRAFNAISEDLASQPISLGMFAAQTGNYTFSLDLRSDLSKVQEVWLYDATQDKYTNLMQDSYTFNTAKTESAGRFFLSVKMAPKVSTDINNVTDGTIWATTQDHTIFVNGLLSNAQLWIYDATGKLLHTDQTQYYQHTYQVPVSGTYFVRVQNTMQTQTIKVVVE